MPAHKELAKELKNNLEEGEAYAAYSARVARRYRSQDTFSKWLVTVASCGPFIDKVADSFTGLSSWLLALIPLLAIALPLLAYSRKIELATSLHQEYVAILPELRELWRELVGGAKPSKTMLEEWKKELAAIDGSLAEIRKAKSGMPTIKKLSKSAEIEAKKYQLPEFLREQRPATIADGQGGGVTHYTSRL